MTQQNHNSPNQKSLLLCILDGWGHGEESTSNAIANTDTSNFDYLWQNYPHCLLDASEHFVGLPSGQMGNSEVGHMNIGAGRVVMQDLPKIDDAIASGEMANNQALAGFINKTQNANGRVHLMGLLSDGGVHSHMEHIFALAEIIAEAGTDVFLHIFTDGRDTSPRNANNYLKKALDLVEKYTYPQQNVENPVDNTNLSSSGLKKGQISIATISGRYYAMDRDNNWDRIQPVVDNIVRGNNVFITSKPDFPVDNSALKHSSPSLFPQKSVDNLLSYVDKCYEQDITDEFIPPAAVGNYEGMKQHDSILFANFRADRARQLMSAFVNPNLTEVPRETLPKLSAALMMTSYSSELENYANVLFPKENIRKSLGEIIADNGYSQLRIAETEKYAHVTFFFSGGREQEFAKEDRILIPSPTIATYDLQPEMSAYEVTGKLQQAIESQKYKLIVVNFANTDMVGHSGNYDAACKAVATVDKCLGQLYSSCKANNTIMCVTADHGNSEQMQDSEGNPHTAHTLNPVPFIITGDSERITNSILQNQLTSSGRLCDIAPTILELLQITKPDEMTGNSLIIDDRS